MSFRLYKNDLFIRSKSTGELVPIGMVSSGADVSLQTIAEYAEQKVAATKTQMDADAQAARESIPGTWTELSDDVSELKENQASVIDSMSETSSCEIISGAGLLKSNGELEANPVRAYTDFVEASGATFTVSGRAYINVCVACSYDSNKNFLRAYLTNNSGGTNYYNETITPKADEAYYRFSTVNSDIVPLHVVRKMFVTNLAERVNSKDAFAYRSSLTGKKWTVCGDSFSHGDFSIVSQLGDETVREEMPGCRFEDGLCAGKYKVYANWIRQRTGVEVVMLAQNGQRLAAVDGMDNCFVKNKYKNIPSDSDIITLWFGINDRISEVPIGDIDSSDDSEFCGAWNKVLSYIRENHPFAHIGIVVSNAGQSPGDGVKNIADATRMMAHKYGYPILDLQADNNLPLVSLCNYREGLDAAVRNAVNSKYRVSTTNSHPNPDAHNFQSYMIEEWIKRI